MNNKTQAYILLCCLFAFWSPIKAQFAKCITKADRVKIEFVNYQITTPISVSCSNFREYFSASVTVKLITDKKEVKRISSEFSSFISRGEKYSDPPDVRLRISFFIGKRVVGVICCGLLLTSVDDKIYINDERIKMFVKETAI